MCLAVNLSAGSSGIRVNSRLLTCIDMPFFALLHTRTFFGANFLHQQRVLGMRCTVRQVLMYCTGGRLCSYADKVSLSVTN